MVQLDQGPGSRSNSRVAPNPVTPAGADSSPVPPIGTAVELLHPLAYLKTAESRPMLRPPDLIDHGERGQVIAHLALGQCAVRFRRGTFLIESKDLRPLNADPEPMAG